MSLSGFDRRLRCAESLLANAAIVLLVLIIASVCLEIVLRTFFNRPQVWVIELSEYALLGITFLGTSWLVRRDGHVSVDLLTTALDPTWRRRLALLSATIGAVVAAVLAVFGLIVTIDHMRRGVFKPTVLEFPTWIVLSVIPLGSALLALRFVERVLGLRSSEDKSADAGGAVEAPRGG